MMWKNQTTTIWKYHFIEYVRGFFPPNTYMFQILLWNCIDLGCYNHQLFVPTGNPKLGFNFKSSLGTGLK